MPHRVRPSPGTDPRVRRSARLGGLPAGRSARAARLRGEELPRLLRLAADYVTGGVIITTAEMGWLYAPYDGGADVIAASAGHRDQLRRAHEDWLSAHRSGL